MKKNKKKRQYGDIPQNVPEMNNLSNKSHEIKTDPMGSYTGRPANPYEKPVQDADDL